MKFRDYVGVKPIVVIKKEVKQEVKPKNDEFYFGYGLSKKQLKRTFDYFKSWFVRYNIQFEAINPYLTLYILSNIPDKREFIDLVKTVDTPKIYPLGTITLQDGFYINYVMDTKLQDELDDLFFDYGIDIIKRICYVKLFEVKDVNYLLMEDMIYSMPRFPYLVLGNIGLLKKGE